MRFFLSYRLVVYVVFSSLDYTQRPSSATVVKSKSAGVGGAGSAIHTHSSPPEHPARPNSHNNAAKQEGFTRTYILYTYIHTYLHTFFYIIVSEEEAAAARARSEEALRQSRAAIRRRLQLKVIHVHTYIHTCIHTYTYTVSVKKMPFHLLLCRCRECFNYVRMYYIFIFCTINLVIHIHTINEVYVGKVTRGTQM